MARASRRSKKASASLSGIASVADFVTAKINKEMRDGSARRLGGSSIASDVEDYISTQSPAIDLAIGRPGFPVGRISLVVGPEASGKSTLVYHLLAEVQRRGGLAVLADTESRFDRERGIRIGIRPDDLVWLDGSTLERTIQEIDIMVDLAREKLKDDLILVVWDSVAQTPTAKEVEGKFGEYQVGEHAKLVSQVMRRWARRMAKQHIAVVIVNQLREAIRFYGPPGGKTMIAEHPLGYASSVTVRVTQTKREGDKEEPTGILSKFYVSKNTVADPFRSALTRINFYDGFDKDDALLRVAERLGWVNKRGGWYRYPSDGSEDAVKFQRKGWPALLAEHPEINESFATLLPKEGPPFRTADLVGKKEPDDDDAEESEA